MSYYQQHAAALERLRNVASSCNDPIGFSATVNVGNCSHRKTHNFLRILHLGRQEMTSGTLGSVEKDWLKFINLSLMFTVLCCGSQLCFAQLDRGSISGVVTDPSGSAVAGARVTVTNTAMGTQNSTVTTGAGAYTVPELAAGEYSITVVATGFNHADPQWNHGFGWTDRNHRPAIGGRASHDVGYGNGKCSPAPNR